MANIYTFSYLLLVRVNFVLFLTWAYSKIPQILVYETSSIMLSILLIVSWGGVFMSIIRHAGFLEDESTENIRSIVSIVHKSCSRITGLYFIIKFGIFSSGDFGIYSEIYDICFAIKVICWINYIWWGAFLLVMVALFLFWNTSTEKIIDRVGKMASYALAAF